MSAYSEFRFYSPEHDCMAVRLSMWDERGGEFYSVLPLENGRRWRARREEALDKIEDAMQRRREPGEVRAREFAFCGM